MANVENHSQILAELARHNRNQNVIQPPPEFPDLPLKTLEEFNILENRLSSNTELKEYLVCIIIIYTSHLF